MTIQKGDGSWERRLSKMRCPKCTSLLTYKGEDISRRRYECLVCKLQVVDVKGDNEQAS
jgi:transposase-like protein